MPLPTELENLFSSGFYKYAAPMALKNISKIHGLITVTLTAGVNLRAAASAAIHFIRRRHRFPRAEKDTHFTRTHTGWLHGPCPWALLAATRNQYFLPLSRSFNSQDWRVTVTARFQPVVPPGYGVCST